jgi:TetR/AcrR family tetracycline transcriptional repressor
VTSALRQFRALLAGHRDAAALLRERPPGPRRRAHAESLARALQEAGFSPADATTGTELLLNHTLDSTDFDEGLEIILDGLTHRLG